MAQSIPNHDLPVGHIDRCQICGSKELALVLDLGHHPPCDSPLTGAQLDEPEVSYPLRLMRCPSCGLAQIDYVVDPRLLFHPNYPYRSGITQTLSDNLQGIAARLVEESYLRRGDFVIDLGSNDGTILKGFQSAGMKVMGVEPTNIAQIAAQSGIPTVQAFFSEELALDLRAKMGPASVITAANMFAHVARLGDLIRGVSHLLVEDGLFLTESHYLLDVLQSVQYDSIYHEHLKIYSLSTIIRLLEYYGFTVTDAERIPNYGGSVRVYAQKGNGRQMSDRLAGLLEAETNAGVNDARAFERFRGLAERSKAELQTLLVETRARRQTVAGIGFPGRASTLLNYCGIDSSLMPYIAEQRTSLKLGMFAPGTHIPIVDESRLLEQNPDYAVMLSWHYGDSIGRKLREKGLRSKIVVPLPEVQTLDL